MRWLRRIVTWIAYAVLTLVLLGTVALLLYIGQVLPSIPRVPGDLADLIIVPPTEVYAVDGSLIAQVGGRSTIPVERVALDFKQAILAVEDDNFWTHQGVDKAALARATWGAVTGSSDRGGSTISQQLAKNLFFTFEKTWTRKFKEILATLEIERRFSKDEILEAYINGIPFGPYAFGVEEAAKWYFSKHASQLTLAESALLAGLPQSPSRYNPYRHPDRALERQRWVLSRMLYLGWITAEEHEAALAEELTFRPLYDQADRGSYFLDAVLDDLEERYGKTVLYHGGLKVYTTMDPLLQEYAVEAVRAGLDDLDERMALPRWSPVEADSVDRPQGALVAMESSTGAVLALVGGRDWRQSQFNRVTQSSRNMGSVLKPVLYLTAVEELGVHPASMVTDSLVVVPIRGSRPWRPQNFNPYTFYGMMPLKQAMMRSLNTVAAKLVIAAGPDKMADALRRFNVRTPQKPNLSIALGATSVSVAELAGIGAGIANLGATVDPFLIRRVEDLHGRMLEEHIVRREQAFDPDDVYLVVDMMKGVIDAGTGAAARRMGFDLPAIGKTGTTNDYRDSWFLGATPRLTAAAWVGFDDNRTMRDAGNRGITGASGALPLWAQFMLRATEGDPAREFRVPPGVEFEHIDPQLGEPLPNDAPGGFRVAVPQGATLPDYRLLMLDRVEDWDRVGEVVDSWDSLVGVEFRHTPFYVAPVDTGAADNRIFAPTDSLTADSLPRLEQRRIPVDTSDEPAERGRGGRR